MHVNTQENTNKMISAANSSGGIIKKEVAKLWKRYKLIQLLEQGPTTSPGSSRLVIRLQLQL